MSKLSDSWRTPDWLFNQLNEEFSFDIDLCATKENSKCLIYGVDYLKDEYSHVSSGYVYEQFQFKDRFEDLNACFMNPPYSNPRPFIEKAWEDSKHCKIVCLVKCDPSTRWWSTCQYYGDAIACRLCGEVSENSTSCLYCNRARRSPRPDQLVKLYCPKQGCEVRFFPRRIKFDPPPGFTGKVSCSSFPCALIIMDRRVL